MKTLRMKILSGFIAVLLLLAIVSGLALYIINQANNTTEDIITDDLVEFSIYNKLQFNVADRIGLMRGYLAYGNEELMIKYYQLTNESIAYEKQLLERTDDANYELIKDIVDSSVIWGNKLDEVFKTYEKDPQLALKLGAGARKSTEELMGKIGNLIALEQEDIATSGQAIMDNGKSSTLIILIVALISVGIGIFLAMFLTQMIVKPITAVVKRVGMIADGNLHGDELAVNSKDEIGTLTIAINKMVLSLRSLIGEVSENAANLAASSEEISASTDEISRGSQQQADEASNSSEMVRDMAKAIKEVSLNAEQAASASETTVDAAMQGGKLIVDTVNGMDAISIKINELSSKSVQIGEIVEVIDDIAEQTNLLALNAAIEAARAGEAGKGFAVVADEVRKLAERSSKATKEISALILTIQTNTDESVNVVSKGNELAKKAGSAFEEIVNLVKKSANKVSEIAAASEQQAAQSSSVQLAVENIAAVSEQTAASVQETAATANDLAKMAEKLNELASKFRL
ncbi:methyl-accepting chemotaxis protein [Bacillus sp. HMF5848]|uniref:methyl-accepting chemotaxis protein n=1 Tax=Bacillus sp. HMF5848 TaxID=2495421 RepID=UPI000F7846ED|nr:methyl-accepting chemotaxis protein [Bacillus sp. HMF5848]RSK28389.1 methyl-accepting chemotaxis protein [Bacillus sp. HMF5848]